MTEDEANNSSALSSLGSRSATPETVKVIEPLKKSKVKLSGNGTGRGRTKSPNVPIAVSTKPKSGRRANKTSQKGVGMARTLIPSVEGTLDETTVGAENQPLEETLHQQMELIEEHERGAPSSPEIALNRLPSVEPVEPAELVNERERQEEYRLRTKREEMELQLNAVVSGQPIDAEDFVTEVRIDSFHLHGYRY